MLGKNYLDFSVFSHKSIILLLKTCVQIICTTHIYDAILSFMEKGSSNILQNFPFFPLKSQIFSFVSINSQLMVCYFNQILLPPR